MKVEEMRAWSREELLRRLEEVHRELFNLRFRLATRQLQNHREVRRVKKDIARINTIITEKSGE